MTLSDTTTGAVIHCTTGGSTPTARFAGMHDVDAEHNDDDQGDCGGDWIQQQRCGERDLHDQWRECPIVNYGSGFQVQRVGS